MKHLKRFNENNFDPLKKISNTPEIKFNGGNPVCICTQCSKIIGRVKYIKNDNKWITLMGEDPSLLCNECRNKSFINK